MRLEFFILVQIISGFMGFLLGRGARNIERDINRSHYIDSDMRIYYRGDGRSRRGDDGDDIDDKRGAE